MSSPRFLLQTSGEYTLRNGSRHRLHLGVREGELLIIAGVTGQGRTTLLKHLAGIKTMEGFKTHRVSPVGYLCSTRRMDEDKTLLDNFRLYYQAYGDAPCVPYLRTLLSQLTHIPPERPLKQCPRPTKQLLSIMRVLHTSRTRLYILDQPTAGLDDSGMQKLVEMLRHLLRTGCSVVVVSQDRRLIRLCSQVVFLSQTLFALSRNENMGLLIVNSPGGLSPSPEYLLYDDPDARLRVYGYSSRAHFTEDSEVWGEEEEKYTFLWPKADTVDAVFSAIARR